MASGTPPSTDTFPWSPYEVFQVIINPYYIREKDMPHAVRQYGYTRHIHSDRMYINAYAKQVNGKIAHYKAMERTPNRFTIVIGVRTGLLHTASDVNYTTKDGEERTMEGEDLDYATLFEILAGGINGKNYDPLKMVRKKHKSITLEMERAVKRAFNGAYNGSSRISKESLKNVLRPIADKYLGKVIEYIEGGNAPRLDPKTLNFWRPAKGFDGKTPLIESGQLINHLGAYVYVDQTEEFRYMAKGIADGYRSMINSLKGEKVYAKNPTISRAKIKKSNDKSASSITRNMADVSIVKKRKQKQHGDISEVVSSANAFNLARNKKIAEEFERDYYAFRARNEKRIKKYGEVKDRWPFDVVVDYDEELKGLKLRNPLYLAAKQFLKLHGGETK